MNDFNDVNEVDLNQQIQINDYEKNSNSNFGSENRDSKVTSVSSQGQSDNRKMNLVERMVTPKMEEAIAKKVTDEAKEQVYKSWLDRYLCCFNWLKRYFKINSKDFVTRVIQSIIPFNSKFYDVISENPDFYGPFWIYSLFVVLVSSCGSLTRTIQGRRDLNFYQKFIPTAALLIYFIGFFVPIFIALLSKLFGGKINVAPIICVYGYSYTIFLPVTIICSIPSHIIQWIFLGYATVSSTSLIIVSIGKSLVDVTKGKKIAIRVILIIFQLIVFCVLKFYFFKHINKELDENQDTTEIIQNVVENTIGIDNHQEK